MRWKWFEMSLAVNAVDFINMLVRTAFFIFTQRSICGISTWSFLDRFRSRNENILISCVLITVIIWNIAFKMTWTNWRNCEVLIANLLVLNALLAVGVFNTEDRSDNRVGTCEISGGFELDIRPVLVSINLMLQSMHQWVKFFLLEVRKIADLLRSWVRGLGFGSLRESFLVWIKVINN